MREFRVHFSFYSEEYGNFDDANYPVMAENPFEARKKVWEICDNDKETPLRNNIKQFADKIGISRVHMSHIEAPNVIQAFSINVLFDIAEVLEIDAMELFNFDK